MADFTTIRITKDLLELLKEERTIDRESYEQVIMRLIKFKRDNEK